MTKIKVNQGNFILKKDEKFRDNYLIGQKIGEGISVYLCSLLIFAGAYGEVRKCQHRKIQAVRAVKILRRDILDEKEEERFMHEMKILKKLVRNACSYRTRYRITQTFSNCLSSTRIRRDIIWSQSKLQIWSDTDVGYAQGVNCLMRSPVEPNSVSKMPPRSFSRSSQPSLTAITITLYIET